MKQEVSQKRKHILKNSLKIVINNYKKNILD